MSWPAIESALVAWAADKSGLGTGKVLWAETNARRPDGAFISLRIGDISSITDRDEVTTIDHTSDVDPPAAGSEIEFQVQAFREFGLTIQCYVPPASNAVVKGAASPRAILDQLSASLSLPTVLDTLDAAGATFAERGSVQYIPEIVGAGFESRAVLEVRFRTLDTLSEFTTYIQEVQATGEDDLDLPGGGPDVDVEI